MNPDEFSLDPDNLSIDRIRGLYAHAMRHIGPDDAAYLFATGKSELEIRNALALYLHTNLQDGQISVREWKRHDLAVIDSAAQPILIIESKVWVHADALSHTKFTSLKNTIKSGLEADLKKLLSAKKRYPNVSTYITTILFSIDVTSSVRMIEAGEIVKYERLHRRGIEAKGDLDSLADFGRTKVKDFLDSYGETMSLPLWEGDIHGMRMRSEVLILKPDFEKLDTLTQ